jgi:hypothetical protein
MISGEMRDVLSRVAPSVDLDNVSSTDCLMVERVDPEIGMLVASDGELERQVLLTVTGREIPSGEEVQIVLAMPILFGARMGTMLNSLLIAEIDSSVGDEEQPRPAKRVASPYM